MLSIPPTPVPPHQRQNVPNTSPKAVATAVATEVPEEPRTIDELVRSRAKTDPELPIVSYPENRLDYVDYTTSQLDQFAYRAAQHYAPNILPRQTSSEKPTVIALLGSSTIDYLVTMLAVTKLGHTALFLSTRISKEAYVNLLQITNCLDLLVDNDFESMAEKLQIELPKLRFQKIAKRAEYDQPGVFIRNTNMTASQDYTQEADNAAWIIHSSGSTGLPKPIFQTHKAALNNCASNMNMRGFITLPLFHANGIGNMFRAIYSRKQVHLYNAHLPLTKQYLMDIMRTYSFEIFYGVPYALKLLAEDEEGIQLLAKCKIVIFGGSACPDALGDQLVASGVNLISHWGSTETGQLMTSVRPPGDTAWDYLRPSATVKPFLRMEERGDGIYEAVCLDGWPSKVMTNRPDGSYAMSDLFSKHPTLDGWKYCGRADDTLVLVNGEKAMPLSLEGAARRHPYVTDAVAFGSGKDKVGLALIRSQESAGISEDDLKATVLSSIEQTQLAMPAYARVSADMILLLDSDEEYPKTDKGTIIRMRFSRQFESQIEALYQAQSEEKGNQCLDEDGLRAFIRESLNEILPGSESITCEQDFFAAGMDSLQAGQVRAALAKNIDVGGNKLGMNIAFEHPSITKLARYLFQLRTGTTSIRKRRIEEELQSLVEKFGRFPRHFAQERHSLGEHIVLTGATGSLGAHIATQLARKPSVSKIYCLVRAPTQLKAYDRVIQSLKSRGVFHNLPSSCHDKIVPLSSDLSKPSLGLTPETFYRIRSEVTTVIHSAWSVNFNLGLSSFVDDCITGARNLIQLCLESQGPAPASFNFCSSVSTVMRTTGLRIMEDVPPLSAAQSMGYAQSKLVTEHLCHVAAREAGLPARVLRIGQIIGDTEQGIWNKQEAIPLMLQAATTIKALPTLDEDLRWLPVNIVASGCIDIALNKDESTAAQVYNIINSKTLNWTRDLLPMLHAFGLDFEEIDQRAWVARLGDSNPDPVANPPVKLLDFWTSKYDHDKKSAGYSWQTDNAASKSVALNEATAPTEEQIRVILKHFVESCW